MTVIGCNNSSFNSQKNPATKQPLPNQVQQPLNQSPGVLPPSTPNILQPPSALPPPSTYQPPINTLPAPSVTPPPVIQPDGITYVNECDKCLQEANNISQRFQNPFTASKSNGRSLGNYKNNSFCDIHFFRNISNFGPPPRITDHEGSGGKVENLQGFVDQVIIYCPCNCGWTPY